MPERKSFADRFKPIVDRYSGIMDELVQVNPDRVFLADYWTALKLLFFASYTHSCYVTIIKKYIDNFYFVDLLSSSGINRISKCKDCDLEDKECLGCSKRDRPKVNVVGSSLIAATANPPFKKMYFVDTEGDNVDVLNARLDILKNKGMFNSPTEGIVGDCNEVIDRILDEIKGEGRYHFLAFVDNQGLNANWSTIDKLLDCYCDIIINFPTSSINRNLGTPYDKKAVNNFLGCQDIAELGRQKPIDYYLSKIRKKRDAESILINTGMGFRYDLIIVTKKNAGFSEVIESLKRNIEENSANEAEMAFNVISGAQRQLSDYF